MNQPDAFQEGYESMSLEKAVRLVVLSADGFVPSGNEAHLLSALEIDAICMLQF